MAFPCSKGSMNDSCKVCGGTSSVGCHGFRSNELVSEYYCETHYNQKKFGLSNSEKEKVTPRTAQSPVIGQLQDLGIRYKTLNGGIQLVLNHSGHTIDYWPTTGKYYDRSSRMRGQGWDNLLQQLEVT